MTDTPSPARPYLTRDEDLLETAAVAVVTKNGRCTWMLPTSCPQGPAPRRCCAGSERPSVVCNRAGDEGGGTG